MILGLRSSSWVFLVNGESITPRVQAPKCKRLPRTHLPKHFPISTYRSAMFGMSFKGMALVLLTP